MSRMREALSPGHYGQASSDGFEARSPAQDSVAFERREEDNAGCRAAERRGFFFKLD